MACAVVQLLRGQAWSVASYCCRPAGDRWPARGTAGGARLLGSAATDRPYDGQPADDDQDADDDRFGRQQPHPPGDAAAPEGTYRPADRHVSPQCR
jgi:hypothetical protein